MVTEAEAFCLSCGVARNQGRHCDYCGRMYLDAAKASTAKPAPLRALPVKYKVKKTGEETIISWRWKNRSSWFLFPFSIIWIAMALYATGGMDLSDPISAFPIPLIPVAIGVLLFIKAVITALNHTSIHASKDSLYVRHYPIPSRRSMRYSSNEIEQVFVSRVQRSNDNRTWHAPILQLVTTSGVSQAILSGSSESQFVAFESLRHEILDALGIDAAPVAGAYESG